MNALQYFKFRKFRITFIGLILIPLILISCGGANTSFDNEKYNALKDLLTSRNFEIENEWAYPSGGGNINLIGNTNFIRFQGDSVEIYLPYFGVRHSGGGYDGEGGIKYKGLAKKFEIVEKPAKGNIEVEFEVDKSGETLNFYISLFPNDNARTVVNTSQRSTISYQGKLSEIKEN